MLLLGVEHDAAGGLAQPVHVVERDVEAGEEAHHLLRDRGRPGEEGGAPVQAQRRLNLPVEDGLPQAVPQAVGAPDVVVLCGAPAGPDQPALDGALRAV